MDGIGNIQWRDCALAMCVEVPADDKLIFNVEYAGGTEYAGAPARHAIIFSGFHALAVNESPQPGLPVLVGAEVVGGGEGYYTLRIETNAGFRVVSARAVSQAAGWRFG